MPFPLAADPKGEAAEAYGVKNGSHANRATFIIEDGKILRVVEGNDALDPDPALAACPLHKPK